MEEISLPDMILDPSVKEDVHRTIRMVEVPGTLQQREMASTDECPYYNQHGHDAPRDQFDIATWQAAQADGGPRRHAHLSGYSNDV